MHAPKGVSIVWRRIHAQYFMEEDTCTYQNMRDTYKVWDKSMIASWLLLIPGLPRALLGYSYCGRQPYILIVAVSRQTQCHNDSYHCYWFSVWLLLWLLLMLLLIIRIIIIVMIICIIIVLVRTQRSAKCKEWILSYHLTVIMSYELRRRIRVCHIHTQLSSYSWLILSYHLTVVSHVLMCTSFARIAHVRFRV